MKYRQERTGSDELDLHCVDILKMLFLHDNAPTNLAVKFHRCKVDCDKCFLANLVQEFKNVGEEIVYLIHVFFLLLPR